MIFPEVTRVCAGLIDVGLLCVLPAFEFDYVRGSVGEEHDVRAAAAFSRQFVFENQAPISYAGTFLDEFPAFALQDSDRLVPRAHLTLADG